MLQLVWLALYLHAPIDLKHKANFRWEKTYMVNWQEENGQLKIYRNLDQGMHIGSLLRSCNGSSAI